MLFRSRGWEDYNQQGSNIPTLRVQDKYAQESGTPFYSQTSFSPNPDFNIAGSPSFDINKGAGALGRRTGEQLLRLQQESGIQNQQLQQELERRGIMPTGISLPPV